MKQTIEILEERISNAIESETGQSDCPAIVRPAGNPKFGDYQANGVMAAAKKAKNNPRELAAKVVEKLDLDDICESPEIAGPGFINLRLKPNYLAQSLLEIFTDTKRIGIEKTDSPEKVVVDFSGPNIAKQMHVGHLRSTIIGDCISRMYEFLGNEVIRQNHIGDWGTQFGMLCYYLDYKKIEIDKKHYERGTERRKAFTSDDLIPDTEKFYKEAKKLFDSDPSFAEKSREYVVKLHSGDQHVLFVWEMIVNASLIAIYKLYKSLNVNLSKEDVKGESEYNNMLSGIVESLKQQGLATESEGAICVFPKGFTNKDGDPLPFIIQKSDGAFLYATTDLAALKFRVDELDAKKIIYVTDARQSLHFKMLFETVKEAGWVDDTIDLQHVTFGTMLGDDGKPFKTRSGENVKLKDLLDEAVERAAKVVQEKNPNLSEQEKSDIANAVGIGAVKYSDYSNNRDSDYIFSFDKMLAMEGNTAPYMQYAYARIKSIQRKAEDKIDIKASLDNIENINLTQPQEFDLAKYLLRYSETINSAAKECRPNFLTTYLFELAQKFSSFYTACPVLKADKNLLASRLLLCELTARTIRHGLSELLGIAVVEKM